MIEVILALLGLLAITVSFSLIGLFLYGLSINNKDVKFITDLKATVIVPCKDYEENLENNLTGICCQDYTNYNVIFVLDSKDDTAFKVVKKITDKFKNTSVEFAEKIPNASGKISALITGVKKTGKIDVLVFADSDIYPHKTWLKYLISGLSDEKIGASTGFRWFFPKNLKSSLLSTWNMATLPGLFHPITYYTWGGSTAIKKELFEKLNIISKWELGFSDDLILTEVLKKTGYKIKFMPQCVLESSTEADIKKFLNWGSQQFTWVRWYYTFVWFVTFIGMLLTQAIIALGFILLFLGYTLAGIVMIIPLLFEMLYGLTGILVIRKLMIYPKSKFGNILPYVFMMPVVFIMLIYNYFLSAFKKEIKWCGKFYRKEDAVIK